MRRHPRVQVLFIGLVWSVLSAVFFLYRHAPRRGWTFGILAGVFIGSSLFAPAAARALQRLLATLAEFLVTAVTWSLLGLAYFAFILPLGLVLRMSGSLRTSKGPDPKLTSYWVDRKPETLGVARYLRPF